MINREIIYERTMTGSYMKIPAGINPGLDERLMLKGKLRGTLPVEKTYRDNGGQYWYNISGKQSLDTYCRVKQIGIAFVEKLVVSICSELEILEWNLIHAGCLMLDPELIYITNSNQEFIFTLYPGSNTAIETEFQQLMEYLLTKVDHRDEAAVRAAYGIYEKTLKEGYSVMDVRDCIVQAKTEAAVNEPVQEKKARPESYAVCQVQPEVPERKRTVREQDKSNARSACGHADRNAKRELTKWVSNMLCRLKERLSVAVRPEERCEGAVVYPEEEIMEPQEEVYPTVCLSSYRGAPRGVLLYQGAEQLADIALEAQIIKIGHGREADVQIERDTISRLHARIDRDGELYYIEDLNSTNGTCVNDEALAYKERRQLNINDIVQFADVRYRFC